MNLNQSSERTQSPSQGIPFLETKGDWLTLEEAAVELRCSKSHVNTLCGFRGGPIELPWFKHGKRTLVKRAELEAYKKRIECAGVRAMKQRL
ncbi:MAG: helix-turn-helix domain-containing protein [Armatimonadetes bacterium]|nr:helix-turn-helix domain-containing protein [Armatimonadota bacterium]